MEKPAPDFEPGAGKDRVGACRPRRLEATDDADQEGAQAAEEPRRRFRCNLLVFFVHGQGHELHLANADRPGVAPMEGM